MTRGESGGFGIAGIDPAVLLADSVAAHEAGRTAEAERLYRLALTLTKADSEKAAILAHLGALLLETERWAEGEQVLAASLVLEPAQPQMHSNRGVALVRLDRFDEAMAAFGAAIALQPDGQQADGFINLGAYMHSLGRWAEALDAYGRAIALNPLDPVAWGNRGMTLTAAGRQDEAVASLDRALALKPDYADAHTNRGIALLEADRPEPALDAFGSALALKPDGFDIHNNRGLALLALNRPDEALEDLRRAMRLDPDAAEARWNASVALLLKGDFEAGLPLYEARWTCSAAPPPPPYAGAPWLGAEPIAGKTLLIHAEQGYGDTVQMLRYAPMLAARGARVIAAVDPPLLELAAHTPGVARAVVKGEAVAFDLQTPMMSLPLALGTTAQTIPAAVPYLTVPPAAEASWANRLGPRTRRRIGLAWSGSPIHKNDRNRSMGLETLLRLRVLDADLFSLQNGYRPGDRAVIAADHRILDNSEHLCSFTDTAGLVQQMDLVISVDTSVAHLAGALARPVFVMLPFSPDHRWHLHRSDSPWYPTARLFRQPAPGDWGAVVEAVLEAVEA